DPGNAPSYRLLAWLLSTCPEDKLRNGKRAIRVATKACELTDWNGSWELVALAAAYAEVGLFDDAVRFQSKAIDNPGYRATTQDRQCLELYKQKKPFRQSV